MSRSNPTEGVRNPATRWFTWAGGGDQGYIEWYDRDAKQNVKVEGAFTFLLLDQLATVKGWHDPSQSGIYANEVKDTRQDALVVRAFKAGELCSGIYKDIADTIAAKGGHFSASLYLAYKDSEGLKIGNLQLKGAALSAWFEFKKGAGKKIDTEAVVITGYKDDKKGGTKFRVPTFALKEVGEATNHQAIALDVELQAFFAEYLKQPKAAAAKPHDNGPPDDDPPPRSGTEAIAAMEDDIPF